MQTTILALPQNPTDSDYEDVIVELLGVADVSYGEATFYGESWLEVAVDCTHDDGEPPASFYRTLRGVEWRNGEQVVYRVGVQVTRVKLAVENGRRLATYQATVEECYLD